MLDSRLNRSSTLADPAAGAASTAADTNQRGAWGLLAILAFAYAVAFVDRVVLSMLVDAVKQDLQITDSQVGLLQGLAFSVVYGVLAIPLGVLTDRRARIPILWVGIAVWSAANIACGFAQNFPQLFAARMFVGIGEAALAPVAASLISDVFAPINRGKAYGIYVSGNTVGSILALAAVGPLLEVANHAIQGVPALAGFSPWQLVFVATGLPGLVLCAILLGVREPERRGPAALPVEAAATPVERAPDVWTYVAIMLGGTLVVSGAYAMISWYPTLLLRVHGWSATAVGATFGLATLGTGVISALASGWVISGLTRRGVRAAALVTGLMGGVAYFSLGYAATLAPTAVASIVLTTMIAGCSNMITPSVLTSLAQYTPSRTLGKIVAIYTMLTGVVSMSAGAYLPGLLNDVAFGGGNGIAPALGTVYTAVGGLAAISFLIGRYRLLRPAARP